MYKYSLNIDGKEVTWGTKKPFPPKLDLIYSDIVDLIKEHLEIDGYEVDDVMIEDEGTVLADIDGSWFVVDSEFQIVE